MFRTAQSLTASVLILSVLGCTGHEGSHATAGANPDPAPVVFEASDFHFTGPDRLPAGVSTLRVVNKGQDFHHIQVVKLPEGKSAADFDAAMKAEPGRFPQWIQLVGGPNAVAPGGQSDAIMNLTTGDYLFLCIIPDKEGVPHVARGMQKTVSVGGPPSRIAAEPKASVAITLDDFRFQTSRPIPAGRQTIEVMNHGTQPHEVVVVELAPNASIADFIRAVESGPSGPPPGRPIGGVVGLDKGTHGFFTAQFEPGRYGLICFFPDAATGQPHFARGMTTEFTVQ